MLTRAQFLVLIICTILQMVMMHEEPRRIGCYEDGMRKRDLPTSENLGDKMSLAYCLTYCRSLKYTFSGLQRAYCFCGKGFGLYNKANESECNTRCRGDKDTTCGGFYRNEIYSTGYYHKGRIGCFKRADVEAKFDLHDYHDAGSKASVLYCLKYCRNKGFSYTAVEEMKWCGCAHSYGGYENVSDLECNLPCNGKKITTCGGYHRIEIYESFYKDFVRIGCYKDRDQRDLTELYFAGSITSVQFCMHYCKAKGYKYTASQNGDLCACGNDYGNYGKASDLECSSPCLGYNLKTCGGPWRNEIYETFDDDFVRIGCYKEDHPNEMKEYYWADSIASVHFCMYYCKTKGYKYTSVSGGEYCSCGNSYGNYGKASDLECSIPCKGNSITTCGGHSRNEIYETFLDEPKRLGCYKDQKNNRDMPKVENLGDKMSVVYCLSYCRSLDFSYSGMQEGRYCFCGNVFGRHGKEAFDECLDPCLGDTDTTCGGTLWNEIYKTGQYRFGRIGCFKLAETAENELRDYHDAGNNASVPYCQGYCKNKGFNYSALQGIKYCGCAYSYGGFEKVSDLKCNLPCKGNKLATCGGNQSIEIYETFYDKYSK